MKVPGSILLAVLVSAGAPRAAETIKEVRLTPPAELTRADLYTLSVVPEPRGILVLCPGMNGNGKALLNDAWIAFAQAHRLGLAALSFASADEDLENGRGYYFPARGAGDALLAGLRQTFGADLSILLYGMSGGAHFTAGFVAWKPQRVISWCAYTAGWWDRPRSSADGPPGIVACGDEDPRYGASLGYFLQGRALGKHWTWISLRKTGHEWSPALDDFVRVYFAAILDSKPVSPRWQDIDLKNPLSRDEAKSRPTLACWLPDEKTTRAWMRVHQP